MRHLAIQDKCFMGGIWLLKFVAKKDPGEKGSNLNPKLW